MRFHFDEIYRNRRDPSPNFISEVSYHYSFSCASKPSNLERFIFYFFNRRLRNFKSGPRTVECIYIRFFNFHPARVHMCTVAKTHDTCFPSVTLRMKMRVTFSVWQPSENYFNGIWPVRLVTRSRVPQINFSTLEIRVKSAPQILQIVRGWWITSFGVHRWRSFETALGVKYSWGPMRSSANAVEATTPFLAAAPLVHPLFAIIRGRRCPT